MVKLPKAIIKKFGITKRAWAEFRKQKGGESPAKRAKGSRKKSHVKSRPALAAKEGGSKMAKRKKKIRHAAKRAGHAVRRGAKRVGAALNTRPGQVVTMAVTAAAGGVVSSMVVNKAPMIKDQSKMVKSLLQSGIGMAAIFLLRNKHAKSLGAGAVIAGVMSLVKETLKVDPLAGPAAGAARLSPAEMSRLTGGALGMPIGERAMSMPIAGQMSGSPGFNRGGFGT